jgi:spore coat protein H
LPRKSILWLIMLFVSTSCYEEVIDTESMQDVFTLEVSAPTQTFIHESRDTAYRIEDPVLQFCLNGEPLELKEIRVRGNSALRFRRKSYSVFLREPLSIRDEEEGFSKQLRRFKLLAMAMDYTYIENRIGFGILEQAGVMPLFYKYVELELNGETEGLYLLVEDPEQYFREQGSEFILRRGYDHRIDDSEYEPQFHNIMEDTYIERFREIYSSLTRYHGQELYGYTGERLNLEQYFRKMGVDYLLQNGDYTDEIFLFTLVQNDQAVYQPIPWDYDDLFREQPHEVGVTWGTGTLFGSRPYHSVEDIYGEIGDKLVFSIEDDLDYTIARDSFMYARYEEALARMLREVDETFIQALFARIREELEPYYMDPEIVAQSAYDNEAASPELWQQNMEDKLAFLEERLALMNNRINIQQP